MASTTTKGKLDGRVAIVTAAAQGLGEAISRNFAREGATVVLVDRNSELALKVSGEIEAAGGRALALAADAAHSGEVNALVREVLQRCGRIDILVNGAGGFHRFSPITEIADEEWDTVINANMTTAFNCIRAVVPTMIEQKFGRIVSITSGAGIAPNPHAPSYVPYGAGKAGLIGMTKLLARDLGPDNITVNCVAPGTALTPRVRRVRDEDSIRKIAERNPMRHLIEPEDCAEAVLYLASNEARYVTGVTLMVNAGNIIR